RYAVPGRSYRTDPAPPWCSPMTSYASWTGSPPPGAASRRAADMLIFATSDKGGTGRSVTSCNVAYRRALQGSDVCYLDFDFGSPTAGAVMHINEVLRGTSEGGLHSYLLGKIAEPQQLDVWSSSERSGLRSRPPGAGRLVLLPGDVGGGEFTTTPEMIQRCSKLLL